MRMDVMQAKEVSGREKPVWLRIGKAFEKEGRWSLKLDVLPLPNGDGDIWLRLFEEKPRDGLSGGGSDPWQSPASNGAGTPDGSSSEQEGSGAGGLDDEIPF